MKNLKNFCKRNKYVMLVLIIFIVLTVLLAQIVNVFFPTKGEAIYGNRLEGIEDVKIPAQKYETIEHNLEEEGIVREAKTELKGRLINVTITLNDDAPKEQARALTGKILEQLDEEQKKYYDIQVFLEKTNDDAAFPIIGYKHHQKDSFSFTKDR